MNFALSQGRTDRYPVGLAVVAGLHVALAAWLLSARTEAPQAPARYVELRPVEPPRTIVKKTTALPQAPAHALQKMVMPSIPTIEVDPDAIAAAAADDKPVVTRTEPTLVALVDGPHDAARVTPRRGVLNAGAPGCRPTYPAAAQRLGIAGISRIRFSVDAAGHVLGAQVLLSSGPTRENRLLDQAAAAALARCPVTLGTDDRGQPVPFTTDVDYVWSMTSN